MTPLSADTIAAISTALGEGGIGIVRLSGDRAIAIADEIYRGARPLREVEAGRIVYGRVGTENEVVDEVLVSVFRKPHSYTREDIVEINCHGGIAVVRRVLDLVLSHGARLAEPGEFTKRAFLNGRLDLSQAEAVIDVIRAKTDLSLRSAVLQLTGRMSERIKPVRSQLIDAIAHIEAAVDYPDEDIDVLEKDDLVNQLRQVETALEEILATADTGRILREGVAVAIVGRPNVGKSSLLNLLLRENRALVTDIAGTTRDLIEETMNLRGIPVRIVDTAGIRQTEDVVETLGVARAKESIAEADIVLFVIDGSTALTDDDREIAKLLEDTKVLGVINKLDQGIVVSKGELAELVPKAQWVEMSAQEGTNLEELEECLWNLIGVSGTLASGDEVIVTRERHREAIKDAVEALRDALATIASDLPYDLASIDLQLAADALGKITGETVQEDIIDRIFERFCLGK
ncbi:MAG: tRNA uridine-5-carboxymethylaminomethyl(34) synthesis GTPase MnmE [Firmicutes bacterium]|nr:tRNA uridine-5-carboxymethylaminomethyl(34) synthesis GTPase MnmE [Bacillota bacterium]